MVIHMNMKNKIIITFIILSYNSSETIEKSINSILFSNIPYDMYEIIIIEDGSEDNTEEIILKYICKNKNIKLFFTNKNKINTGGNLSIGRNIGIKNASGRYIKFLDSDDYFNSIELYDDYHEIISLSDIYDMIITNSIIRKSDNCIIKKDYNKFIFDALRNCYIRKDMINKNKLKAHDEKYFHYSEDEYFFILLYEYSNTIFFLDNNFVYYGIKRDGSHSDLNHHSYDELLNLILYCEEMRLDLLNIIKKEESKKLLSKLIDDSIMKIFYQISLINRSLQ